jgi:hypothetical protein
MKPTLEDIKVLVDKLAEIINAPGYLLPTYGYSNDGAQPHIEVDKNGELYYVVVERGQELRRDFALDTNDLLYRIFADITFTMACEHELEHRRLTEDCRRRIFAKQEELLGVLEEEWRVRERKNHDQILKSYPFNDNVNIH